MADFGIKVSNSGHDIAVGDPKQLGFSSAWFLLKTAITGTATLSVPALTANTQYPASIGTATGSTSVVAGFWSVDNTTWHPTGFRYPASWAEDVFVLVGVDGSGNVQARVGAGAATPAMTIYFRYIAYVDNLV